MKTRYKFRYELMLGFLLCFGAGLLFLLFSEAENAFLLGGALTLDLALILFTLWRLYRTKWKRVLAVAVQKLFSAIAKKFFLWMEKTRLGKRKNLLSGETNIHFHFEEGEKKTKKAKKHSRWRQMKTERQKMRYLYRQTVTGHLRRGVRIYASHTPEEIKGLEENTDFDREILSLYTRYRYDERTEPPEGCAERIKEQR